MPRPAPPTPRRTPPTRVASVPERSAGLAGTLGIVFTPRNRELLGLIPSALLVVAGFTAIFIQSEQNTPRAATNLTLNHASSLSLSYGLLFLGICLAGHLVIRFALPDADPYLFPLVAVLSSVGIVMVYRIDPVLARQQAQWMVVGLILFAATILALRKEGVGVLERYRYTIAAVGHRDDPAAPTAGDRPAGQRRLPGDPHRQRRLPARRVRQGGDRHLPGQLPAGQPPGSRHSGKAVPGPDDPADEAVRPDADRLGGGDGDAADHPRAGNVADVLRGLPGAALRRHGTVLLSLHRPAAVRRRGLVRHGPRQPRPGARGCLGTPLQQGPLRTPGGRQLPAGTVTLRPGRRRAAGHGLRPFAAPADGRNLAAPLCPRIDPAGARKRHDLRRHRQRAGPRRRGRACWSSTCCSWPAG